MVDQLELLRADMKGQQQTMQQCMQQCMVQCRKTEEERQEDRLRQQLAARQQQLAAFDYESGVECEAVKEIVELEAELRGLQERRSRGRDRGPVSVCQIIILKGKNSCENSKI